MVNSRNKKQVLKKGETKESRIKMVNASMSQDEQEMMNKMITETSVELSMVQDKLEQKEKEVNEHKMLTS